MKGTIHHRVDAGDLSGLPETIPSLDNWRWGNLRYNSLYFLVTSEAIRLVASRRGG